MAVQPAARGPTGGAGGPGAGEGLVYVGTSDAEVVARDAETGEEKWIANVSSEVLAAPVAARGS